VERAGELVDRGVAEVRVGVRGQLRAIEAMIDRISRLGFAVRVELSGADGEQITAQLTRDRLEELELERWQIVWVTPARERAFAEL
jgi:ABC-type sulfate/molybdate transport systems ATPase subunit